MQYFLLPESWPRCRAAGLGSGYCAGAALLECASKDGDAETHPASTEFDAGDLEGANLNIGGRISKDEDNRRDDGQT
jgi:hypothetical protein